MIIQISFIERKPLSLSLESDKSAPEPLLIIVIDFSDPDYYLDTI